ncbi:MAG: hypothetical protein ACFE75_09355 [Candidatus Hodarchaeota archaeon]
MKTSRIRLRYSGLIIFCSKIFSVFTGLAFTVIVTRNLSISDFGVWQYLTLIFTYVIFPANLIPYWATRFYARGSEVAKTGVIGNLILSIPAFIFFIIIAFPASKVVDANMIYFYMISSQIFLNYLILSLESLAIGRRPYLIGYGIIVFELSKISFAILLFQFVRLGFMGAIIAVILAHLIQLIFLLHLFRGEFKNKFQWKTLKNWLHSSWLPLYSLFETFIYNLDLLILAILTKNSEPLALYKVAFTVAVVIRYSSTISTAIYPKLLSGGNQKDIEGILKITYMFAIPMAVGSFILAEPILYIFKPEYTTAAPILRMMAPWALINSLIILSGQIIRGTETVDSEYIYMKFSFKRLLKSKLFTWPLYRYVRSGVLLILTYAFITFILNSYQERIYLYTAMVCFLAKFISDAGLLVFALKFSRDAMFFHIPYVSLVKYFLSACIMGIIIWSINPFRFIATIFTIGLGALIYFTSLFLLDVESRRLFKQIWNQLKII